jgi:hypothetical protein
MKGHASSSLHVALMSLLSKSFTQSKNSSHPESLATIYHMSVSIPFLMGTQQSLQDTKTGVSRVKIEMKRRGVASRADAICKEAPRAYGFRAEAKGNNN